MRFGSAVKLNSFASVIGRLKPNSVVAYCSLFLKSTKVAASPGLIATADRVRLENVRCNGSVSQLTGVFHESFRTVDSNISLGSSDILVGGVFWL